MFSKGNESDQKKLDLFRQYHCSDCLKSFQHSHHHHHYHQQQQHHHYNHRQEAATANSQSSSETSQGQMNTPPAPLQDLAEETFTGLYNYFGADSSSGSGNQHDIQPQLLEQPTHQSVQLIDNAQIKLNNNNNNNLNHHQESNFQLNNTYNSSISSVSTSVSQLDSEPIDDTNSDTLSQMSIQNKRQSK